MGRATRWLRGLLGGKKDSKEQRDAVNSGGVEEKREKKRWSFGKSGRDPGEGTARIRATTPEEAAWMRSLYSQTEKEQSKHAIAVAAATAAAADAAVAAAQAAVAVVRLTSQGRGSMFGARERLAAVKIQTAFRGFLAKKALRALKALVKLQALVRGYLVRKQAAATLHSMQALIRAQATIRAQRSHGHIAGGDRRLHPDIRPRRSLERFDESRSEHLSSIHSRRLSGSLDNASSGFDRSPKIVEIDTCRPKSRSSRRTSSPSTMDPSEDLLPPLPVSSPLLPCQTPARITIPDCRNFQDYDWCLSGDKCRFSCTAQSTPRYISSSGNANGPPTPAKSVSGCPNYMSNTQSFEAKVRSQSAPKQRPETVGTRKRVPLREVLLESRASLSGVGMERAEAFSFKSAVVGRMDRSLELAREPDREYYLNLLQQRKW